MKRRAFTLVEMVTVVTIGSALMGVAVVMLTALLKNEGSSRRHLEYCNILNRLDGQFRADAHAAVRVAARQEGGAWELTLPEPAKTLIYRCQPREITREERDGEKILRRESYALPEEVKSSIERKSEGALSTLILRVEPKPAIDVKIRYLAANIEAVLARDHRFEKTEKPKEDIEPK